MTGRAWVLGARRDVGAAGVFAELCDGPGWAIAEAGADAPLCDVLATAQEANLRLALLAENLLAQNVQLREENARVLEEPARRGAQADQITADLAVLQIEPTAVVTIQAEGGAFRNAACFTSRDDVSFAP